MAKTSHLRDFQVYLADRLSAANQAAGAEHWLAVQAGEENWLIELPDSGEIVQGAALTPVPLTPAWFCGLANVRGRLFAVSDLAQWRGAPATPPGAKSRLVLVGARHGVNVALRVSALQGLRSPQDFQPAVDTVPLPAWVERVLTDARGERWYKLSVRALLADRDFMTIGM